MVIMQAGGLLLNRRRQSLRRAKDSRGQYYDYHNPAHRDLINSLALHAGVGDYVGWLFLPFAPAGSLFWLSGNSLINTLWYDGTRVTSPY